jgi:hypothetical protein
MGMPILNLPLGVKEAAMMDWSAASRLSSTPHIWP